VGAIDAKQEAIPAFVIHGSTQTEVFRLNAKGSSLHYTIKANFNFRYSNGWWQVESTNVNSLMPRQTAVEDCMTVPGGVRSFITFLGSTNRGLVPISVCPITYPPPGRSQLLFPWLCLCPDAKLPLLEAGRMRRFPSVLDCNMELFMTNKNEGTYSLEFLGNGLKTLSFLSLTNNGIIIDLDMNAKGDVVPTARPFSGGFEKGFRELVMEVTESTNLSGFSFPLNAIYVKFGPDYYTKPPGNVFTQLVSRLRIESIAIAPNALQVGTIAKRMIAFDRRPDDLPKNRAISYAVSNEHWKAVTDPRLLALARVARRLDDGIPTKWPGRDLAMIVLAILFLSPLVWFPILSRKHQQKDK